MKPNSFYKNILKIVSSTFISRILGYLRDMAVANYFGASVVADTFYIAYRIPNLLRTLFGEGAFVSSFVPIYTDYFTNKSIDEQKKFLNVVFTSFLIVICVITIFGIIFAPEIVSLIAPGLSLKKFTVVVFLTRVMFPFFISIGIASFFMGILYVHHSFFYPSFASCFLSISELFFIFLVCPFVNNKILFLSISVVIGGFFQAFFQLIPIIKKKICFSFDFNFKNEGLKKVFILMLPAAFGASFNQISVFVDMIFASRLPDGSISALYYSNRLMQLPLALFGIAVSTISLSIFSKAVSIENNGSGKKESYESLKDHIVENTSVMSYFILPSMTILLVLSMPIVRLLFERGKFDSIATDITSYTLFFSSLGIFSYASVKIFTSAYYSIKNTKIPVLIASFCIVINVILNFILVKYLKVGGLALSTSISSVFNMLLLMIFLEKKIGKINFGKIFGNFTKILFSSLFIGFVCFYLKEMLISNKIFSVVVPFFVCGILYLIFTYFLKVKEIGVIVNMLRKKND